MTSSHHMAAELTVRKMRAFLKFMRKNRFNFNHLKGIVRDIKTLAPYNRAGSDMFSIRQIETFKEDEESIVVGGSAD